MERGNNPTGKDTVDHVGKAVAGRLDAAATVAPLETLAHVEVAIVVRGKSESFAQRLRVQTLAQVQWTVRAEAERTTTVLRV